MVRREALAGYVQEVRLIAANAKILELDRQRRAAQNASAAFNKAIIEEREAIKILEVDYERRINELLKEESGPETTTTTKPFILTNKDVKIITGAK